jgi:hypothetical protein
MSGRHYSFIRLSMPKEKFDELVAQAKAEKAAKVQ